MSSIVFLISMGIMIYFLLQGDKQDKSDREAKLKQLEQENSKSKKE